MLMHQQRASEWKAADELDGNARKDPQRRNDIHGAGKTSGIQCGGQPAQAFDGSSALKSSAEVSRHRHLMEAQR